MCSELRTDAEFEIQQLRRLLDEHAELIQELRHRTPSAVERSAVAAMLHGFYNGMENIFVRIAKASGRALPRGPAWHTELLDTMNAGLGGEKVISDELRGRLDDYLGFRHFFRHGYSFDIRWERMTPLVRGATATLDMFIAEMKRYLKFSGGN